jgi:putative MATE family efflux protein
MDNEKNMTVGRPGQLIITFAIPLIIGNLGQQFYMIVDSIIVGQGVGVRGLAAVGATDWTYWLFLWSIQALTQGFSIPIAQRYGMGDLKGLKKALAMSLGLCGVLGLAFTALGFIGISPLLHMLKTPSDIYGASSSYLRILFGGLIAVMAYNMASAILRAFGDGKTPLAAMVIAAVTNIALDLLFVMVFDFGVAGAAAATVIAQAVAFGYCLFFLLKHEILKFGREDLRPEGRTIRALCGSGGSLAFTHILIAVGGMILQSAINFEGAAFIAAFTAANKLLGLLESSAVSLGYSVTTYIAQNWGAKLYDRIKKGLKASMFIAVGLSLLITSVMIFAGRPILSLFINAAEEKAAVVLNVSYRYLFLMSCSLSFLYLLHVLRNALQGIGCGLATILSGAAEFAARVSVALYFSRQFGGTALMFAEPSSWVAATAVLAGMGIWRFGRL